jgi:hypothetical protein
MAWTCCILKVIFIQANVKSPQAKNLFTLLDERLKLPVFCDNMAASNTKARPYCISLSYDWQCNAKIWFIYLLIILK